MGMSAGWAGEGKKLGPAPDRSIGSDLKGVGDGSVWSLKNPTADVVGSPGRWWIEVCGYSSRPKKVLGTVLSTTDTNTI